MALPMCGDGQGEVRGNNVCEGSKCKRIQNVLETKRSVVRVQIAE